jgi:hypothetical protein
MAATLTMLDESLCSFDRWARGHAARGVLYEEDNDLSPEVRRRLRGEISGLRSLLRETRNELGLQPERQTASHLIWIACSMLWEHLVELECRYLKAYGSVPADLAGAHDARMRDITRRLDQISKLARSSRAGSPHDQTDD